MATFYKPLTPGQEIVIGPEQNQEYHASVLYHDPRDAPDDSVRMRSIYVSGDYGYVLGIAYRFTSTGRIYVKVFTPTKEGTPFARASARRKHTRSGFFDSGTGDAVLVEFVRKVAFGEAA